MSFSTSIFLQVSIINVYGFSHTGPIAMMWNHMAHTPLPEANWVIAGDFNNIESVNDKQGISTKTSISNRELKTWNKSLLHLGVRDAFQSGSFHKKPGRHLHGRMHIKTT